MGPLDGQVAIVTGASSGIGAATAEELARAGAFVVAGARRADRLQTLIARIEAHGGRALGVPSDITNDEDRRRLVETAQGVEGAGRRLALLVNNAGAGQPGPLEVVPVDRMRRAFETNLFGPLALTQLVIPILRDGGGGRIVNVSSIAGRIARPFSAVYDATKHALEAASDGLRGELAPFGIRVVTIEPGFIVTEFTQVAETVKVMGPLYAARAAAQAAREASRRRFAGSPEEVARVILLAASTPSPKSRYVLPRFARVTLFLKRFLPERVFERISGVDPRPLRRPLP